jgi:TonB family protein
LNNGGYFFARCYKGFMLSFLPFVQIVFGFLSSIVPALAAPQSARAAPQARGHMTQDQLCCVTENAVSPIYPREARLAGIQGEAKLLLVIGGDNTIAELQPVSGDPVLVEAAMKAVRQWRFTFGAYVGEVPRETEVPLTFTFKIEDPPEPAYLHLKNGKVIRADSVREFTDRMEYTVDGHTHRISAESVRVVDGCARVTIAVLPPVGGCIPSGAPNFDIRAIPLLPAIGASHAGRPR